MRKLLRLSAAVMVAWTLTSAVLGTYERGAAWTSDSNQVAVFGGSSWEYLRGMFVDSAGNTYTTGSFQDTVDFDPESGTANLTSNSGSNDVFVTKISSSGNLVWAKAIGGAGNDVGHALTVDSSGNVFVVGRFERTVDFDPGANTVNVSSTGFDDGFIVKLDPNGSYEWARAIGGTSADYAQGVAVDSVGNAYTTGYFQGTVDFDPGAGTSNLAATGGNDAFIQKLDPVGDFVWAAKFGNSGNDYGNSITIDDSDNILIHGDFAGTVDFDPGPGTENRTAVANQDVYILKLDSSGNLVWVSVFGGNGFAYGSEEGRSISVDNAGNVYTTGHFSETVDFDPGAGTQNLTSVGNLDVYVSKLDSSGGLIWAKQFGGLRADYGYAISVGDDGSVYTAGSFDGTSDFDPSAGTENLTSPGGDGDSDAFIAKLDSSGGFAWAKSFVGTDAGCLGGDFRCQENNESAHGLGIDGYNNLYVAGQFVEAVDFDPSDGTEFLRSIGSGDVFIVKMDSFGSTTPVVAADPVPPIIPITPIWRVTFDPNSGTCVDSTEQTESWTSVFVGYRYLPNATDCLRPGYTFTSWASTDTPTKPTSLPVLVDPSDNQRRAFLAANADLVAIWTPNPIADVTVFANFMCGPCTNLWVIHPPVDPNTTIDITVNDLPASCTTASEAFGYAVCELTSLTPGGHTITLTPRHNDITGAPTRLPVTLNP